VGIRERLPAPAPLPWRRPRHELLLLALVALGTLTVVFPPGAQDVSRMCLTRAVVHGSLAADGCLAGATDMASFGGHLYSDKAPAVSFLAIPAAEIVRLPAPSEWHPTGDLRLWAVRLSTGGLALLACALLVGRVGEGLAPGWGGAMLVTFATGTLAASLAADNFAEVPTAAVGFAAFLLAWRRRPGLAGLLAGLAVLIEYQAAVVIAAVAAYTALAGARALGRYVTGLLPGLALLGLYDRLAFGSPFHLSYRYVSQQFASQQAGGFFGIGAPSWHAVSLVLVGNRGLLVDAPVLVLAAAGLVLLARAGFVAEAVTCAAVTVAFLVLEFGYFDPYGGDSPGPRFFIPALPFLVLGLAPAFARFRLATSVLAAASVVASTAVLLTWPTAVNAAQVYRWSVWRELASLPVHGTSALIVSWAQKNLAAWVDLGRLKSALLVGAAAVGALALALRDGWRSGATSA
jgi:hypothetical protein